jgi:hypothetical protein
VLVLMLLVAASATLMKRSPRSAILVASLSVTVLRLGLPAASRSAVSEYTHSKELRTSSRLVRTSERLRYW